MASPFKTDWANIHISVPVEHDRFLTRLAELLGMSKNATYCLTLRMGGPLLHAHAKALRASVRGAVALIQHATPATTAEIPGPAELKRLGAMSAAYERTREARRKARRTRR